jgi:hypothetical protein
MKGVNPYIKQFKNDLTKGKQCVKIFFPMCGDVADTYNYHLPPSSRKKQNILYFEYPSYYRIYCHTKSIYVIY